MRWRSIKSGQTTGARQVRVTWRCLYIDLEEDIPPPDTDIGSIEHAIVRKAHDFLDAYPANLVRIQEIRDTMVYRFTHGRHRVATWFEREQGILWICAADQRDEDTYDHFVKLHADGELLPGTDDWTRMEVEAATKFVRAVREQVPRCLQDALENHDTERHYELPTGGEIRLLAVESGAFMELWVAMPTLTAPAGLTPQMRAVVLAALQRELPESEWEERHDWPAGQLPDYEISYLGIREL